MNASTEAQIITIIGGVIFAVIAAATRKWGVSLILVVLRRIGTSVENAAKKEAVTTAAPGSNGNGNGYLVASRALDVAQQVMANTSDIQTILNEQRRQQAEGAVYLQPFLGMMRKIDIMYRRQEQLLAHFKIEPYSDSADPA